MTQFHVCVTHIKLPMTGKYGRGFIFESSTLTKQNVVKSYESHCMCLVFRQKKPLKN